MRKRNLANSWNLWFAPLFKFIAANDIKALCYISCDWDATSNVLVSNDGEIHGFSPTRKYFRRWLQETSQDRYS